MKETIHYSTQQTSLGYMALAATSEGICFLAFDDDQAALVSQLEQAHRDARLVWSDVANRPEIGAWMSALNQHLCNGAELPDMPLDIRGTEFETLVWNALRGIPAGQVLGYSQLAEKIDRPDAVRATASACGRNRIAVLIPCHRVLRGDGQLGGYRWGLARKQALLKLEQPQAPEDLASGIA